MTEEKRKVGRPSRADLKKARKPGRRSSAQEAAIADFTARIINSPKSGKLLDNCFRIAMDDNHKHQAAAMKMLIDRMLPMSYFEKASDGNGEKPIVNINITRASDEEIAKAINTEKVINI